MHNRTSFRRSAVWTAALGILLLAFQSPFLQVSAASPTPASAKIDQAVLDQVAANGSATFWVMLEARADLAGAESSADWSARGKLVYDRLIATADSSQAGLRAQLRARKASFQSFWISNTIRVTGGLDLLNEIAARGEVASIAADRSFALPEPVPSEPTASPQAVEWGVDRIKAPMVWSIFNDHGEGITVANIDSGVQFNHPALVNQYRGRQPDGSFNHNYNWYDPSAVCPFPQPCDNNNHGTHTMGTMVGDDGGSNQIGVAPRARWIAAKGCESSSCSSSALLSSGQWMLAPTDLSGLNPRPDLRPHVINNSWSGSPSDTFYRSTVQAWVAAGMFPAFANGNTGPMCATVRAPGAYPESYGVGAFDINNNIADFSGRGASATFSTTKPDISAPGVNVRSSITGSTYGTSSGTSMATPHLAATVALLWSVAPALVGNITQTRTLLGGSAIPTSDLTCGGTAGFNNVWGHGRLDAFSLVTAALNPSCSSLSSSGAGPSRGQTVAWAPGRLDLFERASGSNGLWHEWYQGGWGGPEVKAPASPGTGLVSDPVAVTWSPGRLDAFGIDGNGKLDHWWFDGAWHSEQLGNPGSGLVGQVSVVSWGVNRIDIAGRTSTPDAVWHLWWDGSVSTTWSAWENHGNPGVGIGDPSLLSWAPGRIDIFAIGVDGKAYHQWWPGGWYTTWEGPTSPVGMKLSVGAPAVVAWAPGRLDIVVVDVQNCVLWHRWYGGAGWSSWESLGPPPGSSLISDASLVAWSPGRLDVFALGNGGNLMHKWYAGGSTWAGWENQGTPTALTLTARPTTETWEPGRLDVFNRDSSGHVRHNWWPGPWGLWEDRGAP